MPEESGKGTSQSADGSSGAGAAQAKAKSAMPQVLPAVAIPNDLVVRSLNSKDGEYEPNTNAYPILLKVHGKPPGGDRDGAVREVYGAKWALENGCTEVWMGKEAYRKQYPKGNPSGQSQVNVDVIGRITETEVVVVEGKGKDLGTALFIQLATAIHSLGASRLKVGKVLAVTTPISDFMYTDDFVSPDPIWSPSAKASKHPNFEEYKDRRPKLSPQHIYLLDRSLSSRFMPSGLAVQRPDALFHGTANRQLRLFTHVAAATYRGLQLGVPAGDWGGIHRLWLPGARGAPVSIVAVRSYSK